MDDGYMDEAEHAAYHEARAMCASLTERITLALNRSTIDTEGVLPDALANEYARLFSVVAAVRFHVDSALARHVALASVE